jgi:hypothetical protein
MLILVIIFVFFILHIQFLLEVILWGRRDFSFFFWDFSYPYSDQIAIKSLIFVFCCLFSFLFGYFLLHKKRIINIRNSISNIGKSKSIFDITLFFYIAFILLGGYIIISSNFSYAKIVKLRERLNFLFELRIIPLLLTSYIMMNSRPRDWKGRRFKKIKNVLILYGIMLMLLQTRSIAFEFGILLAYYWIRLINDRFKIRYILYFYLISLIPNIILLFRIDGLDLTDINTYSKIFTYEYSLLFNNILSEVISNVHVMQFGKTLSDVGGLLVPSFLRNIFGIKLNTDDIRTEIAHDAGVFGGGFSLLAEFYLNFGYISILLFLLLGILLSFLNNKILYKNRVSMIYAATPLFYSCFLVGFRNGLNIFIKQIIQLFIIVIFFVFIMNVKYKQETKTNK